MSLEVDIKKELPQFKLELAFSAGSTVLGILGSSGAGKSMTLRCIAGLETPARGRIILQDTVLFDSEKGINLPAKKRQIGFLFQNYALFPHLTVWQNISFGLLGVPKKEQVRRVEEKIAMVRLEGFEHRLPHQLSGGQQQRTALARALIMEPRALLLDEPFSALDSHLKSQVGGELLEVLSAYRGVTIFVTHDLEELYRICDKLMILNDGQKIATGNKEDLFERPPTYTAARLTGCNNLSRARAAAPDIVEAVDWGVSLRVNQPIPPNLTHIGIRTHHLKFVRDCGPPNVFPCRVSSTGSPPHRMSLSLSLSSQLTPSGKHLLQCEVCSEKWKAIKDRPFPWLVHLNPDLLFLTEG